MITYNEGVKSNDTRGLADDIIGIIQTMRPPPAGLESTDQSASPSAAGQYAKDLVSAVIKVVAGRINAADMTSLVDVAMEAVALELRGDASRNAALSLRLVGAIRRNVRRLEPDLVRQATSSDDISALGLVATEALKNEVGSQDLRARLALKGALRFKALIEERGGVYDIGEAAQLLNSTPGAVQKKIERNQLLAYKQGGNWALPKTQFDLARHEPLRGLKEVLSAMASSIDQKSRILFCLSNFGDTGKNPLQLLVDNYDVERLSSAAANYLEHGSS